MIGEAMRNTERGSRCIAPRDRLIETLDPGGGSTKFGYDLDDNEARYLDLP